MLMRGGLRLAAALVAALALKTCITTTESDAGPRLQSRTSTPACHRVAQHALIRVIRGETLSRHDLTGCWGLLDQARGSENIPILSTAAAVVTGLQDPQDLLPVFRGVDPWPPGELCSEIYGSWLALAVLTVHNRVERPAGFHRVTGRYLRALWTLFTLSATTAPPDRLEVVRPDSPSRIRSIERGRYRGAWLNCPGMRSADRDSDAYWSDRTDLHALLSAALGLDWQPRRPLKPAMPGEPQWVLWWTHELAGRRDPPADFWGLEDDERQVLRSCLAEPSLACARRVVRWLAPLRPRSGVVRVVVRFEDGGVVALQNVETNRVKFTQYGFVIAGQADGTALRVAARYAHVAGDELWAWNEASPWKAPLDSFGQEIFRVVGTPERWWVLPANRNLSLPPRGGASPSLPSTVPDSP